MEINESILSKRDGENEEQFIWRLGTAKDSGKLMLDWNDIALIINREFRSDESEYRTEAAYRKRYTEAKRFLDAGVFGTAVAADPVIGGILSAKRDLEKEKIKIQTEKLEYNRWLREEARGELISEKVVSAINNLSEVVVPEYVGPETEDESKSGVLAFGDEHYGADFVIRGLMGDIINEYNPEVFERRMWDLLFQVKELVFKEGLSKLRVYSLGDFTDGVLRVGQLMRLRYGVIEGSVKYANFIAEWLNELTRYVYVEFQMTDGNHSELRMLGQPKGTFKNENTGLFVREFIKVRLKDNPRFTFIENSSGLIYDTVEGFNILGVHGEVKNMENAIKDFQNTYRANIDVLITGHFHHAKGETVGILKEVVNVPSIIGVDPFSMDLNKVSLPGAKLLIFKSGKGICTDHRIIL